MRRRDVAAATVAMWAECQNARAQNGAQALDKGAPADLGTAKLARLSIMNYNCTPRRKLEGQSPNPNRILEVFDLPQYLVDTYGVRNVEMQHSHFASTDDSYLKDFRRALTKRNRRYPRSMSSSYK